MENTKLWQAKLAARVHDPAEKALVLMRDPAGHEGGTTRALLHTFFPDGLSKEMAQWVKQADHWASAADRPQFPQDADKRYSAWAQVRFDRNPEIKHPLTGQAAQLDKLEIDPQQIKAFSTDAFLELVVTDDDGRINWQKTLLSFWRFGSELNPQGMAALWRLLPADTRIPDHSIWAHLDLTSAFCGAFAADPQQQPALLQISIGPVQPFIAAGRSTSDLWAGSHLLSRIVWEGMKVICEQLGPDAIIFPQIRGIPMVDLWLMEQGLDADKFANSEWKTAKTDANPLFSAALPNKFVALVPAAMAKELAEQVTAKVRSWVSAQAESMLAQCLKTAVINNEPSLYCHAQLKKQLQGFPEVYWAAVPWLSTTKDGKVDTAELAEAMQMFYPQTDKDPGFLGSELWALLNQEITLDQDWKFYRPNPGVLYPAVFDLLDRVAAATKSIRPFEQAEQQGYRNTLSGEQEWLTTEQSELNTPPGQRKETIWLKVAEKKPSWVKKGEHLSALDMLKRLWPSHFLNEMQQSVPELQGISRYVVSTHDMCFSTGFENWLKTADKQALPLALLAQLESWTEQSALPKKVLKMAGSNQAIRTLAKKLPTFYEAYIKDVEDSAIKPEIKKTVETFFSEKYYALILMDGDKMGAWLAGSEEAYQLPFKAGWHSKIGNQIEQRYQAPLKPYLESMRPPSPARHMAISEALNSFSLHLVRYVVEELYKGKVLYAGGDDVMAMVAVDDLLPMMLLLRLVYSGDLVDNGTPEKIWQDLLKQKKAELKIKNGYVANEKSLYRVMGSKATASCGAVIAHHTAPLAQVLNTLRKAEQRAKNAGGRNAFAIDVMKRAGSVVSLTCPWRIGANENQPEKGLLDSPMGQLMGLLKALKSDDLSRRAAYIAQEWMRQAPPEALFAENPALYSKLLIKSLQYPLFRQSQGSEQNSHIPEQLVSLALSLQDKQAVTEFISNFIGLAEFMARETRAGEKT